MEVFQQLGVALLLGLLVGLQRERAGAPLAGFRTFPLITLLGALCGLLGKSFGGWSVAAGLISLAILVLVGNLPQERQSNSEGGVTTEVAMLVMFAVGAFLTVGQPIAAVAVGAAVAVLLQFKPELHGFVRRLEDDDVRSIMQFVLIAFIVLPVLPNQGFGPFAVLNPYEIWFMVVLIVGISLVGYLIHRFVGDGAGTLTAGVLGGIISSTATTTSYSRMARKQPLQVPSAATVVMIASTIVYGRLLMEIRVVAPGFLATAAPRIGLMAAVSLAVAVAMWLQRSRLASEQLSPENPSELKPAVAFGLLYAAVLLGVAAAKSFLGQEGLFAMAAISGLTDMDAITLSTSRLVAAGQLDARLGWQMIVVATMANLCFKTALIASLGPRSLVQRVGLGFGLSFLAGALLLIFA